ncbi:hypothetical protein GCM10023231_31210 [Olivibacter ginsenosidimutans]|uniref:Uncharacterized protein n=1 Tax=Olivibacter ginsenosidimutans TaxID=1176537 RepID=A0ABP9BT82_9SPHI
MRVVVLFLLCLSSFLFRISDKNYAHLAHNRDVYTSYKPIKLFVQFKSNKIAHSYAIIRNGDFEEHETEVFNVESEDDSPVFARRDVLISDNALAIIYTSLLHCYHAYLKEKLPFCTHLTYISSYKYILQRVLRI